MGFLLCWLARLDDFSTTIFRWVTKVILRSRVLIELQGFTILPDDQLLLSSLLPRWNTMQICFASRKVLDAIYVSTCGEFPRQIRERAESTCVRKLEQLCLYKCTAQSEWMASLRCRCLEQEGSHNRSLRKAIPKLPFSAAICARSFQQRRSDSGLKT